MNGSTGKYSFTIAEAASHMNIIFLASFVVRIYASKKFGEQSSEMLSYHIPTYMKLVIYFFSFLNSVLSLNGLITTPTTKIVITLLIRRSAVISA